MFMDKNQFGASDDEEETKKNAFLSKTHQQQQDGNNNVCLFDFDNVDDSSSDSDAKQKVQDLLKKPQDKKKTNDVFGVTSSHQTTSTMFTKTLDLDKTQQQPQQPQQVQFQQAHHQNQNQNKQNSANVQYFNDNTVSTKLTEKQNPTKAIHDLLYEEDFDNDGIHQNKNALIKSNQQNVIDNSVINQRQKMMEQQKNMMMKKANQNFNVGGTITANSLQGKGQDNLYLSNEPLNLDSLSKVIQSSNAVQYEPGQRNNNASCFSQSNLPSKLAQLQPQNSYQEQHQQQAKDQENLNSAQNNMNVGSQKFVVQGEGDKKKSKIQTRNKKRQTSYNESDDSSESSSDSDETETKEEKKKRLKKERAAKRKLEKEQKVKDLNVAQEQIEETKVQSAVNKKEPLKIADTWEIEDMKAFLNNPLPQGYIFQMTIKRDKGGITQFYPKYHMSFSNGLKYLCSGKKQGLNKTSNYSISLSKDNFKKNSEVFIGKLRSNFLGTEFNIYNNGENPKKAKNIDRVREQLGVIIYESNLLGSKGPRKMKVMIPEVKENGQKFESKPIKKTEGLLQNYKQGKVDGIKFLFNKPPKWNEQVQAFVLNFNGRIDKPSVKNFQLIEEKDDNVIFLQFGRIANDIFNLDAQWPLSPLQAFAICLSSFDYKIACE